MSISTKHTRFQAAVLPHLNAAFNLARWLTRSHQDAEDIVQEAYLRAFRSFEHFHGDDGRVWLLTIVRNTFYSWYQHNKKQQMETQFEEEIHSAEQNGSATSQFDNNDPENLLVQHDSQKQLQQALEALPLEFREVMIMRELEDLSYKQIAEIIGIPMGTVMSRLGRGRKHLALLLAAHIRPGRA